MEPPTTEERVHRDAGLPSHDAASPPADGGRPTGGDPGPAVAGAVSCYLSVAPNTTCTLPSHCCFTNFSAQHDGECASSSCGWGTIDCDGPEDCRGGQHCCAHAMMDSVNGLTGYKLGCQASACGGAPINQELCHPTASAAGTCSGNRACVPARDFDYDLPRTLYICQ
jgi:hypothetical protein